MVVMKNFCGLSFYDVKREIVETVIHEVNYNSRILSVDLVSWILEQRWSIYNIILNELVESIVQHDAEMNADNWLAIDKNEKMHSIISSASRSLINLLRVKSKDFWLFTNEEQFKSHYKTAFFSPEKYTFHQLYEQSDSLKMQKFHTTNERIEESILHYRASTAKSALLERIFISHYLWKELKKIHETDGAIAYRGGEHHIIAMLFTNTQIAYIILKFVMQLLTFILTWLLIPLLVAYMVFMNGSSIESDFSILILLSAIYLVIITNKIVQFPSRIIRLNQVKKYAEKIQKAIGDISKYMEYLFADNFNISQFKSFLYRFDADFGPCDPELYNLVEQYSRSKSGRNGKGGATSGAVLSNDESSI